MATLRVFFNDKLREQYDAFIAQRDKSVYTHKQGRHFDIAKDATEGVEFVKDNCMLVEQWAANFMEPDDSDAGFVEADLRCVP